MKTENIKKNLIKLCNTFNLKNLFVIINEKSSNKIKLYKWFKIGYIEIR